MFKLFGGEYPADHWSKSVSDKVIIGEFTTGNEVLIFKINNTDNRCRFILSIHKKDNFEYYYNKPYEETFEALKILNYFALWIAETLSEFGIITQYAFAANNSMSEENGEFCLGNSKEPFMPHLHIMLRVTSDNPYLGHVKLGDNIDLKNGKVPWESEEKMMETAKYVEELLIRNLNKTD